jgi:hypothetical protein
MVAASFAAARSGMRCGSVSRLARALMVATLGQDLSEPFELYSPPAALGQPLPPGGAPSPLGVSKPRGAVHRDGDWHRSVHVWLTDGSSLLLQRRSAHKVRGAVRPVACPIPHGAMRLAPKGRASLAPSVTATRDPE